MTSLKERKVLLFSPPHIGQNESSSWNTLANSLTFNNILTAPNHKVCSRRVVRCQKADNNGNKVLFTHKPRSLTGSLLVLGKAKTPTRLFFFFLMPSLARQQI